MSPETENYWEIELAGEEILIQFRLRCAKLFAYRLTGESLSDGEADVKTIM
ncbi:MAG: hypothetical protein ACLFWL_15680 [Candidatus Brocadiia bacterium]